ncbi:Citrinin biosynthesis cluster MFS transporter mrr1 [Pseudocercospora fuligena]|uniref:Citrinin biosynthesis cluster MFS transporter mrr1 n=1 Tax=Pseudocercospora fuligena TaxID=685502 RepID=A0A8H6RIK6_9PEZI|nr:Citrinin biosynthesis cluster MFS transporter mrr1 [Pseudocercospora fuligena]
MGSRLLPRPAPTTKNLSNPINLPKIRKWLATICLSSLNFTTTFASSVFSSASAPASYYFHVSEEAMVLGTSLFLCGFIEGSFIFGPLSELYGRKTPLFCGFITFAIFQIPVAVAQKESEHPDCHAGGALADMWSAQERGFAVPIFAGSLFGGPIFGPILGSFITQSSLGWRWTQWITLIMAATFGAIAFVAVPETYAAILLTKRAKHLRHRTHDWALHSLQEEKEVTLEDIGTRYLLRPTKMLFLEPILFLVTIYMAFVFGVIYLCFEAFPISFGEDRNWSPGVASLPFLSVLIGALLGCSLIGVTTRTRIAPDPSQGRMQEARLPLMAIGGIIAGAPVGFGLMLITLQGMNYIIDCYTLYANSALAANTSVRYALAAGFPLFASGMYHNLRVQWATSVVAFISLALVPVPVLFWRYGDKIRGMSRYVMT